MKIIPTTLEGILIIEPKIFGDTRGFFYESYHLEKYSNLGIKENFVQDNFSHSSFGTLRGLHYQLTKQQAKLVSVSKGKVFDVAVDIRFGSPNFGKWFGTILSEENLRQMYIPKGFAHGFYVLSNTADFSYKCSNFYSPEDEHGIQWDDPKIAIDWPLSNRTSPILSIKDSKNWNLKDIPAKYLPTFEKEA
jgi:dTDP-4-dehydrorhamnose 3,5-epimerase